MINLQPRIKHWLGGLILLAALFVAFSSVIGWRMQRVATVMTQQVNPPVAGAALKLELRLTQEQEGRIRELDRKYQMEVQAFCERHCSAKMRIGEILKSGRTDDPALLQLGREVGEAYAGSEEATLQHVAAVCSILNPEQKAAFLKKVAGGISATCPTEFVR